MAQPVGQTLKGFNPPSLGAKGDAMQLEDQGC
jgi:hypothetical protein